MKYIDVSEWQGAVDWETAKPHIDGAVLRAGWGAGRADRRFARNAAECNRLGIPCGAYWFSYAKSVPEAEAEAAALLAAVKPYRMELPLIFDFEYDSVSAARAGGVEVSKALATDMVRAFCETVEAGGCYALFYANPDFLTRYFDAELPRRFGLWLAQWPGGTPDLTQPPRRCAMWQWTNAGRVPGVSGDVDISEAYADFAELIRAAGSNRLSPALASPSGGGGTSGASDGEGPLSDALAWAVDMGILSADAARRPTDTPTLAAVAEMFYMLCRDCRSRRT